MDDARLFSEIRDTMEACTFCILVTRGRTGDLEARLMDPLPPEEDLSVWMVTDPSTRKVRQLEADPRATLAYVDEGGIGYVTLLGRARLVTDLEERRRRWRDEWKEFYPEGPEGETFALIEFRPERIEAMSVSREVGAGPFEPACLILTDEAWTRRRPPDV